MHIERLWMNNPLRNFNYIIACPETKQAMVIDPLDAKRCYDVAQANQWQIKKILNTHEHFDHIEGNAELKEWTDADIYAHHQANIEKDIALQNGDEVSIGKNITFQIIDSPGHTMTHICLFSDQSPNQPVLFCGDTLFNAGIGHCKLGGEPNALYETLQTLMNLPGNTKIYPGHDYLITNLEFTLDREPDNATAQEMLSKHRNQDPNKAYVSTLEEERAYNVFMRLNNQTIIEKLSKEYSIEQQELKSNPKEVFLKLRQLRNHW